MVAGLPYIMSDYYPALLGWFIAIRIVPTECRRKSKKPKQEKPMKSPRYPPMAGTRSPRS